VKDISLWKNKISPIGVSGRLPRQKRKSCAKRFIADAVRHLYVQHWSEG